MDDDRTYTDEEGLAAGPQAGPGAVKGTGRFDRARDSGGGDGEAPDSLREELREAVGHDAADRVSDRQIARAAERSPRSLASKIRDNFLLVAITFGVALVVGAVLALSLESWWVLVTAVLVHAAATVIVVGMTFKMSEQVEKPDPTTVARLEAGGVTDVEGSMNELVDEAGDRRPQTRP